MPLLTLAPLRSYDYLTSSEIVMVIKRSAAIRARIECEVMKADSQLRHHSKPDRSMHWPQPPTRISAILADDGYGLWGSSRIQRSEIALLLPDCHSQHSISLDLCPHFLHLSRKSHLYRVLLLLLERLHHHTALVRSQKVLVISPG